MKTCHRARKRLLAGDDHAELHAHLETCAACTRFARRARAARGAFEQHQAGIEPDAGFPARVTARLRRESTELLGWAAVRLLPATLVVVVTLGWFAVQVAAPDSQAAVPEADSDDLIGWIMEETEP